MESKVMKTVLFAALIALTSSFAHAADQQLDASVLAQAVISGGFRAPGAVTPTISTVKKDGEVIKFAYRRGDLGPDSQMETLVRKLDADTQLTLEREIAEIHEGKLVDINPNGPTGA